MQCPIDQTDLLMTERNGVEIDYCPKCRGVWLDRGELDKIVDRAADAGPTRPAAREVSVQPDRNERDTPQSYGSETPVRKKKRGSFLEDLFDF
jgi:Zn-finger nucleic acid-binding protein